MNFHVEDIHFEAGDDLQGKLPAEGAFHGESVCRLRLSVAIPAVGGQRHFFDDELRRRRGGALFGGIEGEGQGVRQNVRPLADPDPYVIDGGVSFALALGDHGVKNVHGDGRFMHGLFLNRYRLFRQRT
jgi:hypothetical protein